MNHVSVHGLTVGFHGCDQSIGNQIIARKFSAKKSINDYDWLGHGFYLWENDPHRAYDYAVELKKRGKIHSPYVIGAVFDPGLCLNLISNESLKMLKGYFNLLSDDFTAKGKPLPVNRVKADSGEWLLRPLDCAVIELLHQARADEGKAPYDSVRGVFFEGSELYPDSGFREKNHIQICIRNLSKIVGFFNIA